MPLGGGVAELAAAASIGQGPGADVGERPEPIDAHVGPEIDEDDHPAQALGIKGWRIEPYRFTHGLWPTVPPPVRPSGDRISGILGQEQAGTGQNWSRGGAVVSRSARTPSPKGLLASRDPE